MKIKSLLVGMLACTALVGCSNEDEVLNGAEAAKGEKGYIAVNFAMPGGVQSRATTANGNGNGFESGTSDEVAVKDAVFLFLDGNFKGCAKPYYIEDFSEGWKDADGTGVDKENKVLVVDGAKGEVPSYIVAILNPTDYNETNYNANTTLAELKNRIGDYSGNGVDDTKFVMSNAAYHATNNKEMIATPVTIENIASSKEGLNAVQPVTIQVERAVAKVAVTGLADAIEDLNENGLKETIDDAEDMKLKFVLTGWEVLQANESRLIKNIDASNWNEAFKTLHWNDVALKRSYWANDYQNTLAHRTSYDVTKMRNTTHKYVEETVNQTPLAASVINDANPYLLVAGKFVDAENNSVNLVEWRGQKYTAEGYLNFIAGYAELSQYYTAQEIEKDGEKVLKYTSFSADLLTLADDKTTDWKAQAVLKDPKTKFYTVEFEADGKTVKEGTVTDDNVAGIIAKFGDVQYWNGGNTYYFVPIKHQNVTAATETDKATNFYGVVRNHYYKVNISQIIGYGTAVSNPEQFIDSPEVPKDEESWMEAAIEILDWKVVENNGVVLGQ